MMKVAIYDLDKTLVRRATFTPFLVFASGRLVPLRLMLFPVWALMMAGYRLGFYDRTALKSAGIRLMLGRQSIEVLEKVGREFAAYHVQKCGWIDGVLAMVEADRKEGAQLVIATAAFEFYARAFADSLGITDVIATLWDGTRVMGENCYGEQKRARVMAWLNDKPGERYIRFVSDSFADEPMFNASEEPVFVTQSARKRKRAELLGWAVIDGSA